MCQRPPRGGALSPGGCGRRRAGRPAPGDLRSPGGEELPDVVPGVHALQATGDSRHEGVPGQYPSLPGLPSLRRRAVCTTTAPASTDRADSKGVRCAPGDPSMDPRTVLLFNGGQAGRRGPICDADEPAITARRPVPESEELTPGVRRSGKREVTPIRVRGRGLVRWLSQSRAYPGCGCRSTPATR